MIPSVSPEKKTGYEWITANPKRLVVTAVVLEALGAGATVLGFIFWRELKLPLIPIGPLGMAVGLYDLLNAWGFRESGETSKSTARRDIPIVFKEESIPKTK